MVRYRNDHGKGKFKSGFATKRAAEKSAEDVETSIRSGSYVDPQTGKETVEKLSKIWKPLHHANVKASTLYADESALQVHVLPHWGTKRARAIEQSEISAWVATLHIDGASPTLIERCLGVLKKIVAIAVDVQLVRTNPSVGVKGSRKVKTKYVYL